MVSIMNPKVILADIDGTLITSGNLSSLPEELKDQIQKLRKKGVLFSLISGRDKVYQGLVRDRIFEGEESMGLEARIYEDACIILGNGEEYTLGGLSKEDLSKIHRAYREYPEVFRGMVPLPGNQFTIRMSYVTEEFARGQRTNERTLQEAYEKAIGLAKELIPTAEVRKSGDGLDFVSPQVNKKLPFTKYLAILEDIGKISPQEVLAIGDAANDLGFLETARERDGKAAFVGEDESLIKRLDRLGIFIPKQKGPLGTLEAIRHFYQ